MITQNIKLATQTRLIRDLLLFVLRAGSCVPASRNSLDNLLYIDWKMPSQRYIIHV